MLRFRPAGKEKMGRVSFLTDVEKDPVLLRGGTLQLELSASFHPAISGRKIRYNLRAAAFTQDPGDIRPEWMGKEWRVIGEHSVAHAARGITREAGDLGWQTFTLTIDVPPETRRFIVSLGAFTGDPMWYYLDDVRATVLETPEAR